MSDEVVPQASKEISRAAKLVAKLSPSQQTALQHLGAGSTMADAARLAGVDRRTVFNWIHRDPKFGAAYNAWQHELLESARARALAMSDKALTTLDAAIANGNASAALQLVRQLGVLRPPRPGPTDPQILAGRRDLAIRRRKLRHQDQVDQITNSEDELRKRRGEERFTVEYCTGLIGFLRERREIALIREAAKSGKSPAEIRKAFEERDAYEWEQSRPRVAWEAKKFAEASGPQATPPSEPSPASPQTSSPSSPPASPPAPPALPAPSAPSPDANATALVKTHATRIDPTPPQPTREVPQPYVEPEDDGPWVRYS